MRIWIRFAQFYCVSVKPPVPRWFCLYGGVVRFPLAFFSFGGVFYVCFGWLLRFSLVAVGVFAARFVVRVGGCVFGFVVWFRSRFVCAAFGGFGFGGFRFGRGLRFGGFRFFALSVRARAVVVCFSLLRRFRFGFLGFGCFRGRFGRCGCLGFAARVVGFVGLRRFRRLVIGLSFRAFFIARFAFLSCYFSYV